MRFTCGSAQWRHNLSLFEVAVELDVFLFSFVFLLLCAPFLMHLTKIARSDWQLNLDQKQSSVQKGAPFIMNILYTLQQSILLCYDKRPERECLERNANTLFTRITTNNPRKRKKNLSKVIGKPLFQHCANSNRLPDVARSCLGSLSLSNKQQANETKINKVLTLSFQFQEIFDYVFFLIIIFI